jgi:hypothetical protein
MFLSDLLFVVFASRSKPHHERYLVWWAVKKITQTNEMKCNDTIKEEQEALFLTRIGHWNYFNTKRVVFAKSGSTKK